MIVERIAVGEQLDHVPEPPDFASVDIVIEFGARNQSCSD